jgi:hypothetical protein
LQQSRDKNCLWLNIGDGIARLFVRQLSKIVLILIP